MELVETFDLVEESYTYFPCVLEEGKAGILKFAVTSFKSRHKRFN